MMIDVRTIPDGAVFLHIDALLFRVDTTTGVSVPVGRHRFTIDVTELRYRYGDDERSEMIASCQSHMLAAIGEFIERGNHIIDGMTFHSYWIDGQGNKIDPPRTTKGVIE